MAVSVSLNDIAKMLNTKGGDMSTIGGAIGCMSAMISADAREKENTTGNDVKKIKEFVCGDGGSLSSMIEHISEQISEQTREIERITKGMGERRISGDATKVIKEATSGIEKRLDKMIDAISVLSKQHGGMKWGGVRRMKETADKVKGTASSFGKKADAGFGKFVSMVSEMKNISIRDLAMFKPKMKVMEKIVPQIKDFSKKVDGADIEKTSTLLEKFPKMLEKLLVAAKISKTIKERDFKRLYAVLGLSDKGGAKGASLMRLMDEFSKMDSRKLKKARDNADSMSGMVKAVCSGMVVLTVSSPVIIAASILSKPLEWALFGFKGDGGIFGLFRKMSDKSKDIKEANKSIFLMSVGLASLGAGLGLMFAFTKNVDLVQLAEVAVSTLAFAGITVLLGKNKDKVREGSEAMLWLAAGVAGVGIGLGILYGLTGGVDWEQMAAVGASIAFFGLVSGVLGKFKDDVREGSEAMLWLSAGMAGVGIGLGILYGLTRNVEWEQMAMVGTSVVFLSGVTVAMGILDKGGRFKSGAIAMAVMGAALIPLGISMKMLTNSVRGVKWSEMGILATTILTLGGTITGLGFMMLTGVGALAWGAGVAAVAAMGAALIPFGIGMKKIKEVSRGIVKKDIDNLSDATKNIFTALSGSADRKKRGEAKRNARALNTIAGTMNSFAKGLKRFNSVSEDSIDKAMNSIERITKFFFSDKAGEGISQYSIGWKKRVRARREADTIGTIASTVFSLSTGLKRFNDVSDDSITKAMDAVGKIATYFFSTNSPLHTLNTGWLKRRKADKTSDTIGNISDCVWKLANGMKYFNEVGPDSIEKAKSSIDAVAEYFFSPNSTLNSLATRFFRRNAKKNAGAIGNISESLQKLSKAMTDFNQTAPDTTDRMMESVKKVMDYFYKGGAGITGEGKPKKIVKMLKRLGNGLKGFNKSIGGVDMKKVSDAAAVSNTITDTLKKWDAGYLTNATQLGQSMGVLSNVFKGMDKKAVSSVGSFKGLLEVVSSNGFGHSAKTVDGLSTLLKTAGEVDSTKASGISDMVKSFGRLKNVGKVFADFGKYAKYFGNSGDLKKTIDAANMVSKSVFSDDKVATTTAANATSIGKSLKEFGKGLGYFMRKAMVSNPKKATECVNVARTVVTDMLAKWDDTYKTNADNISYSMGKLVGAFNTTGTDYIRSVNAMRRLFGQMSGKSFGAAKSTISSTSRLIGRLNTVDVEKALALTEMFRSFASIGKSGNLFGGFDRRVRQFTEACINLVNAINGNTDAINGRDDEITVRNEYGGGDGTVSRNTAEPPAPRQMVISNVEDLAAAIADHMNTLNVDCDANINLQINNESGNEWRISRM
jgi:gas vesicle protein